MSAVLRRADPTHTTTRTSGFDEMERAFEVMDSKLDDVVEPLITF